MASKSVTGLEIRKADRRDGEEIAQIFRATREHDLPYLPKRYSAEGLALFQEHVFAMNQVDVAVRGGKIVAFCAYREGWLDHLYVLPEVQHRGIGTALLQRAMKAQAELQLWVFQRNESARRFYERHGFRLAERTDGATNMEKEPDARYAWTRRDDAWRM